MEEISHSLLPYPGLNGGFTGELSVRFWVDESVHFSYVCKGDLDRLLIPDFEPPRFEDGLWEHTCFEAFIAGHDDLAYREFNFSPSGKWACYDFVDYRKAAFGKAFKLVTPQIKFSKTQHVLTLEAVLPLSILPVSKIMPNIFKIGLSAVLETKSSPDNLRSYWALAHPASKPDFHHRDSFILEASLP